MPNPLEDLTGKNVIVDGVPMPDRKVFEFVAGDGVEFEASDDSVNGRTVIELSATATASGLTGSGTPGTVAFWDSSSSLTDGLIVNANVSASAAIALSKLAGGSTKGQIIVGNGTSWEATAGVKTKSSDLTDADATVNISDGSRFILPAVLLGGLTANRILTLGTSGSPMTGDTVTVERYDVTAYTYAIANGGPAGGTLFTFPVSVKRRASFQYDGANWVYLGTEQLP
jgi:hypothetical protein